MIDFFNEERDPFVLKLRDEQLILRTEVARMRRPPSPEPPTVVCRLTAVDETAVALPATSLELAPRPMRLRSFCL
jgi:hypothetical protein